MQQHCGGEYPAGLLPLAVGARDVEGHGYDAFVEAVREHAEIRPLRLRFQSLERHPLDRLRETSPLGVSPRRDEPRPISSTRGRARSLSSAAGGSEEMEWTAGCLLM